VFVDLVARTVASLSANSWSEFAARLFGEYLEKKSGNNE
jgi:hypothetical protein